MSASRTAGDLCSRDAVTVLRSTPLGEASRLLRERHVGCLVVVEAVQGGALPVGVLTDRDIVTAVVARDSNPSLMRVGDAMSEDLLTAHEDASVHHALALMQHRHVRRLPVVDAAGLLLGLLSADDVLSLLADELRQLAEAVVGQRQVERMVRP